MEIKPILKKENKKRKKEKQTKIRKEVT